MKISERSGWLGEWEVVIRDKDGNIIERTGIVPNLITDDGLDMFRDLLHSTITDGGIKYIALGSGTTVPANSDHQLASEQFRKLTTVQTNDATIAGKLVTELYVADTDANSFKTEEIGWFAGSGATATANSGILIARVLYSRQKNNLESWTIHRVDTIGRV